MPCYGFTLAHLFTLNSISKLGTSSLALAVMEGTRQPPSDLLCQTFAVGRAARAAQSRPNGRQRLRRKVRSMTLSSFTNQKNT